MNKALGQAQDRQRLTVACGVDRNVPIELEVVPHAGPVGDVADGPRRVDVGEHRLEGPEPRRATAFRLDAKPRRLQEAIADTSGCRYLFIRARLVEQGVPGAGRRL